MMRHTRVYLIISLVLVLLITACSAQAAEGQVPEATLSVVDTAIGLLPEDFVLNLPRLEVTYDKAGIPGIFGIKTTMIQSLVPVDLSFLHLPQSYIDWFTRSNLQHIEIEYTQNGLFLYANGQPLPSIRWNVEVLENSVEIAGMLGVQNTPLTQRLVLILQRLGIDIVLRFPVTSGNAPIALRQRGVEPPAPTEAQEASAVIHLTVKYDKEGVPSILGLTSRDLARLTGANLSFAELPTETIASLKDMNLQNLKIQTRADGLRILVNEKELPRLAYGPEQIDTLVGLYAQMYPGQEAFAGFLRDVLMLIQQADVELAVQFPPTD